MAKSDRSQRLDQVTFRCGACKWVFSARPGRIEEAPDRGWHPYLYFCECPVCHEEAAQAPWEKALLKAWQNATGPRTEAGKAATAANLEGHPTPEEALRTRFNGMKHGLSAKTAMYFPAKPDKYPLCGTCDIDRDWCAAQPACVKQTQNFMLHHAAFETRNPKHLQGLYAGFQAALFSVVQQILQQIIADGAKLVAPQWYVDKESGRLVIADYLDSDGNRRIIEDVSAHPLFKPLGELLSRNNLSLSDMGMTAKVIEEEEASMGRLESQNTAREALTDFAQRTSKAVEDLRGLMSRASSERDRDPILIEYQQQNGEA